MRRHLQARRARDGGHHGEGDGHAGGWADVARRGRRGGSHRVPRRRKGRERGAGEGGKEARERQGCGLRG